MMIHRVLPLLLLLFASMIVPVGVGAQPTFQMTFTGERNSSVCNVRGTRDGGFIITGNRYLSGGSDGKLLLLKSDSFNRVEWGRMLDGFFAEDVGETRDGGYFIAGGIGSTNPRLPLFIKINSTGTPLWAKRWDGASTATSAAQTGDGGFIIAASVFSGTATLTDILLIRTDSLGQTLWSKAIGGDTTDTPTRVRQTADGGFIVLGRNTSHKGDLYAIRTDSDGDILWSHTYGGAGSDYPFDALALDDGGFLFGGYLTSQTGTDVDGYLLRTDSLGRPLWSRTYGGRLPDYVTAMVQDRDGGFTVGGRTYSFGPQPASGQRENYFLLKTDSEGKQLWSKIYGRADYSDWLSSIIPTGTGYMLGGVSFGYGTSKYEPYFVMTDSAGNSGCTEFEEDAVMEERSVETLVDSGAKVSASPLVATDIIINSQPHQVGTNILCSSLAVEPDHEAELLPLSPNPVLRGTTVRIAIPSTFPGTPSVTLTDAIGAEALRFDELVMERSSPETVSIMIPTDRLAPGPYLIRVRLEGDETIYKLIVW